jgi:hypothetical protein
MFFGNNVFDYNLDSPKKVQSHKVMSEDINNQCSIILHGTCLRSPKFIFDTGTSHNSLVKFSRYHVLCSSSYRLWHLTSFVDDLVGTSLHNCTPQVLYGLTLCMCVYLSQIHTTQGVNHVYNKTMFIL